MRFTSGEMFQFTRPRGARRQSTTQLKVSTSFNSRAHGGRDGFDLGGLLFQQCFNSRAHGGRDPMMSSSKPDVLVSIHAPTGGATCRRFAVILPLAFQFTRPRGGATIACLMSSLV